MKWALLTAALLLVAPSVAGEQNTERARVHETYSVVITADVIIGLGVDIQQLGWICHLSYDATMPDSDLFDETGTVTSLVTVSCTGPGTILFSNAGPPDLSISNDDPSSSCQTEIIRFQTGASSTTRYGAGTILVTLDEDDPHPEKCSFVITVSVTETGEEWELSMPVTIYNDDATPGAIGLYWLPLLLLLAIMLWGGYTNQDALVLLGIVGIVGLHLETPLPVSMDFIILAAVLLAGAVYTLTRWKNRKTRTTPE